MAKIKNHPEFPSDDLCTEPDGSWNICSYAAMYFALVLFCSVTEDFFQ
jgi:hypothetical protein